MNSKGSSPNPASLKPVFAFRFLRALSRIKRRKSSGGSRFHGGRKIKLAADASMAAAVGSRRAWSRAVLRRRLKARQLRRRPSLTRKKSRRSSSLQFCTDSGREGRLRQLVPGGGVMDFCSLLDETAHYIECLSAQVQVMQTIADRLC